MAKPRRKARVSVRDTAEEIVRRALAAHPDGVMPYVLRLSDPPTHDEQLQMMACQLLGKAVAIMPGKAIMADEWLEQYAPAQA
jgi:hypothetical protein